MTDLASKLRSWQPAIVDKTVAGLSTGNFLNASDLGTGKTYCAVAAAIRMNRPVLAICRIGARHTWHEVADHFGWPRENIQTINRESLRRGNTPFGQWVTSTEQNHASQRVEKKFKWTVDPRTILVFDEIHWDAGLTSQNSKVLRSAVSQGLTIMGLSGTAADDPRKMRAIGFMLGLHNDWDFHPWLGQFGANESAWTCGIDERILETAAGRKLLADKRSDHMRAIHKRLAEAGRFVRVRKSEIPGFPKCSIFPECVDFDSRELKKIFEEMAVELTRLKKRSGNPKKEQREVMMRALQKAELLMVPTVVEEVEDAIEEGHSVAIFVSYTETAKALAVRLNTDMLYTGEQDPALRESNRLRFVEDRERKIIVNVQCGSESIGLQDVRGLYPRMGIVFPLFNAVMAHQVFGRLPRAGAKSPSIYKMLFPAGTIMEQAYYASKAKAERINAFNGDFELTDADLTAGLDLAI